MRYGSVATSVVLLLALLAVPVEAGTASSAFRAGVEAAGAGDHETALAHFRAAREAGLDTPALHFNLGVTLYRLGRLDAAATAFERAADADAMAGPAAYNRGRIARERDDPTAAARWFCQAVERARTDELRARAQAALDDLRPRARRGQLSVAIGGGHDSNVLLAPDDDVAVVERESSTYLMLDLYGQLPLSANWAGFAGLYAEDYSIDDDLALTSLYGGAAWREAPQPWRREARLSVRHTRLGGEGYEDAVALDGEVRRAYDPGVLRLEAGADHFRGARDFPFLDGHRLRGGARWFMPALGGGWSLRYRLSRTDRDDAGNAERFRSFSYTAHDVRTRYRRSLTRDWTLRVDLRLEHRRHADAERRDGEKLTRRDEMRYGIGGELERHLGGGWFLAGSLEHETRESNLDEFDYDRTRVELRLERDF